VGDLWSRRTARRALTERIDVSQYRLAAHLTLACIIYAAIVWTVQHVTARAAIEVPARMRLGAMALLALVLVQIYLGALVAGLDAGLIYNTWPLIDGGLLPSAGDLFPLQPVWRNLFETVLTVQFNHRMMAYVLWFAALLHAADVARGRTDRRAVIGAGLLALAVTAQACLGILTLIYQTPMLLALLHQGMALVVLTIALIHAERLQARGAVLAAPRGDRALEVQT
jgi:cytochrome c oxidase assembly protein subunit 15